MASTTGSPSPETIMDYWTCPPLRLIPNKDRPTKGDRDSGCPRGQQLMCNGAQNHTLATALFVENALQLLLQSKPLHQHGKLLWLLLTMQARTVVMPLGPAWYWHGYVRLASSKTALDASCGPWYPLTHPCGWETVQQAGKCLKHDIFAVSSWQTLAKSSYDPTCLNARVSQKRTLLRGWHNCISNRSKDCRARTASSVSGWALIKRRTGAPTWV